MTSKPISRRTALRSIGQGAAIAAGAVAIPGSSLATMTSSPRTTGAVIANPKSVAIFGLDADSLPPASAIPAAAQVGVA